MSDPVPSSSSAPLFALAIRGYDRRQVDSYIEHLREQLEECAKRLHRTEQGAAETAGKRTARIAELEEQLAALEQRQPGAGPTAAAAGSRIAQMLELAVAEAAEVKQRAGREAEQLLEHARREARELRQEQAGAYELLQRQLQQLRASVLAVLDGSAPPGPTGRGEVDARTGDEPSRPLLDEVTQVLDAAAAAATAPQRRPVP